KAPAGARRHRDTEVVPRLRAGDAPGAGSAELDLVGGVGRESGAGEGREPWCPLPVRLSQPARRVGPQDRVSSTDPGAGSPPRDLADEREGAGPAAPGQEVGEFGPDAGETVRQAGAQVGVPILLVGPEDDEGPPFDVVPRNESPGAAVPAV